MTPSINSPSRQGKRHWLWVFGEIEGLRWVLRRGRMAFARHAISRVRRMCPGDDALLYVTRGAFHNPTRDEAQLAGRVNITGEPCKGGTVTIAGREFSWFVDFTPTVLFPEREGIPVRPLVHRLERVKRPEIWGHYFRNSPMELSDRDDNLLREALQKCTGQARTTDDPGSPEDLSDPGVLEILGALSQLLGLTDHLKRLLGSPAKRRHRSITNRIRRFSAAIQDARAACLILRSVIEEPSTGLPEDAVAFPIRTSELPLARRGMSQFQKALQTMLDVVYDLEDLTRGQSSEHARFYRISQGGTELLAVLRQVFPTTPGLDALDLRGNQSSLINALDTAERYLVGCAKELDERATELGLL